jgi:hypothetical protein
MSDPPPAVVLLHHDGGPDLGGGLLVAGSRADGDRRHSPALLPMRTTSAPEERIVDRPDG